MRFLTLEDCSDSELHCVYHDPERTVTLLHPRTACSLQFYAPEEEHHSSISTYHTRRPNSAHSWWLQLFGVAGTQLLGLMNNVTKTVTAFAEEEKETQAEPTVDRELIRHHLVNLRSVIPHHDALDEEEHIESIRPLPSPWSFPSNVCYREARHGYLQYLSEPLIVELVTLGLMLVNDVGIRWNHLDQYVFVRTEQEVFDEDHRPRLIKLDPSAYREAAIRRLGINGEVHGAEVESPGTPIIEVGNPTLAIGQKRVRLYPERTCVLVGEKATVVRIENLEDNEGKTAEVHSKREARKRKKQRARASICWDSERRP